MTWMRAAVIPVLALVIMTVRARVTCDVTRLKPLDIKAFTGIEYLALASSDFGGHLKRQKKTYEFFEEEGEHRVGIYYDYETKKYPHCRRDTGLCKIVNNGCENWRGVLYSIAQDSDYSVTYMKYNPEYEGEDLLTISVTDFKNTPVTLTQLPPNIIDSITDICGKEAAQPDFYRGKMLPGDVFQDCSKKET